MHTPGLAELPPSRIPAKRDQGGICSYFCTMHQNQVALLGVKLSALKKCSSQPCSSAPPPHMDNLQPDRSDHCSPAACRSDFFGRTLIPPGAWQISVIQAPRQHVELRFALIKLLDHSHSLCISTVKRCVSTGLRIMEI